MRSWLLLVCLTLMSAHTRADNTTGSMLLGINQGKAGQEEISDIQDQYAGFASFIARTINKPVKLSTTQDLNTSNNNLGKGRFAFFYARPANIAAKAIQSGKYRLVAMAQGTFLVKFIVNKDSPLKKPEDIRGKEVAIPVGTFMEQAGLAELRDHGLRPGAFQTRPSRYQDAVAYMVQNHYADVGMVAPLIANQWEKDGGRVLFASRKMPFWSVIASTDVSDEDVEKVRTALINLKNTADGQKLLQQLGVKEFVPGNQQDYLDMLAWLNKK